MSLAQKMGMKCQQKQELPLCSNMTFSYPGTKPAVGTVVLTLVQEHICTVSQENVIHSQWPVAGPFWSRSTKMKEV